MIDALIPLAALVRRELVCTLRINRSIFMLALLVGIPAICVVTVWPMEDDPVFAVRRVTEMISQFCVVGLFVTAVLILPAQAATAVRGERDRDTLVMLMLTRISPRAMLLGHALNCFGVFALYAIATLPVVCTVYLLTGLDWRTIPVQYGVIAVAAINCIVAGLVCTSFATTTPRAVIGAYLLAALMLGGYVFVIQILTGLVTSGIMGMDRYPFEFTARLLWQASPPSLLVERIGMGFIFTGGSIYLFCIGIHSAISIVGGGIALIGFTRLRKEKVLSVPDASAATSLMPKRRGQAEKTFRDTYNIVFQREYRVLMQGWWSTRRFRIGTLILAGTVFVVTLGIVLLVDKELYAGQDGTEYEVMMAWMMGCVAVICMVAPGVSTPLWIRERDQETREQLIMTLLRPRQIILGKAAAAVVVTFIAAGIWIVSSSPLLVCGFYFSWQSWTPFFSGVLMLAMLPLTLIAIGSQTPHMRVNSTVAIALSYAFGIAYIAFPVFFQELYFGMFMNEHTRLISQCITLAISPLGSWAATTETLRVQPLIQSAGIPVFVYWAGALSFQLAAAYLFLRDSIRNESAKVRKGSAS